jgi:hypothetical protein
VDEERFASSTRVIFDQANLAEGGQLADPAAYVERLNSLLLQLTGGVGRGLRSFPCQRRYSLGMKYLYRSITALAIASVAALVGAEAPEPVSYLEELDQYPQLSRLSDHAPLAVRNHLVPLGAIEKIRGVWAPRDSERYSGTLQRFTWQVLDGFTLGGSHGANCRRSSLTMRGRRWCSPARRGAAAAACSGRIGFFVCCTARKVSAMPCITDVGHSATVPTASARGGSSTCAELLLYASAT